ncbi:hypothetical protein D9M69_476030 [compost metagenome]
MSLRAESSTATLLSARSPRRGTGRDSSHSALTTGRVRIGAGIGVAIGGGGGALKRCTGMWIGSARGAARRGSARAGMGAASAWGASPACSARRLRSMRSRTYSWNESVLMDSVSVSLSTDSVAGARRLRAGCARSPRTAWGVGLATGARLSSAAAITSKPPSVERVERMTALSPKVRRALAMASREVGAVKRWMFMLQAPQESGQYG